MDIEIIAKLKNILNLSKQNHKKEIFFQPSLKDVNIYCKINNLSGQISGPLIENYIKNKYSMIKNSASLCVGDVTHNKKNIEIKISNGGKDHNKFNFVQIRLNHDCDYLLTAYYLDDSNIEECGELFIFNLTKDELKPIIKKYGGYSHGTIKKHGVITEDNLDDISNEKEYSLRPKYGDLCWQELLNFRIDESRI